MLAHDQLTAFEQSGYFVLEGVFRGEHLAALQQESEALAAALPASEEEFHIWHERVLFRRRAFRDVLDSSELVEALAGVLGDDVQLLSMDLLLIGPGHDRRRWHRDVSFVCNKALSVNAGIYLYDMTPQMGPVRIVPGSHRREDGPPEGVDPLDGQIEVPVSAGDVVVFDAGIWHSSGVNRTTRNRLALFGYFGRYWIKRMDNYFTQPLPADLLQTADPMKRQLLGLGLRPGVASYHGDSEEYNRSRGEPGIDFPLPG